MAVEDCIKEVLTIDEAAKYMGLKKSYMYRLTSERVIPHFKPNGKKVYFKRSELDAWMTSNPVRTAEELDGMARVYCMGTTKKEAI